MSKRAPQFDRVERDFYPTPAAAVVPLLAHLAPGTRFIEPCAGDGALVRELMFAGHECVGAFDVEPRHTGIERCDVFDSVELPPLGAVGWSPVDAFITNPPWSREILHPLIARLAVQRPTWLLFDADWAHTAAATEFLPWCEKIVSVGQVKWFPGSKHKSMDHCCWYLFDADLPEWAAAPVFFGKGLV